MSSKYDLQLANAWCSSYGITCNVCCIKCGVWCGTDAQGKFVDFDSMPHRCTVEQRRPAPEPKIIPGKSRRKAPPPRRKAQGMLL